MLAALAANLTVGLVACGPDDPTDNNTSNNTTNNNTANNTATNNTTANNTTANNTTANNTTANNTTANNTTANNTTANNTTPNNTTPNNTTPNNTTPNNTTPNNNNTTPDPCADVTCDTTPASCEGNTAVTYSSNMCVDGVCEGNMEMRTNCEDTAQVCVDGACVDPMGAMPPTPGDIIITEIMYDPAASDDDFGEWVELYNTTDNDITLVGSKLKDSANTFDIPMDAMGVVIPAKSYFVLGVSDDTTQNGGVDVDYVYMGFGLNNGGDVFTLEAPNGDTVASVDYSNGFADPRGRSLQFDGALDIATEYDSVDGTKWCPAPTPWMNSAGDAGSPGEANPACPAAVLVTIQDVQDEMAANHPAPGTEVLIDGAVLSALALDMNGDPSHGFIQDPAGGEFSGIYVSFAAFTAADVANLVVGESVISVTGLYDEANGNSQIAASSFMATGTVPNLDPTVVDSSLFADATEAEKYEGVFVRINEAGVTNENADDDGMGRDFGEFLVDNNVRVDDLLFAPAVPEANCEVFSFIQGPVNYSFSNYKIEPRDANDYGMQEPVIVSSTAPTMSITDVSVTPPYTCVYAGGTATLDNSTSSAVNIVSRNASDNSAATNPALMTTVDPMDTYSTPALMPGTYHFTSGTSGYGAVVVLDIPDPNMNMGSNVNPGDIIVTEIMYDPSSTPGPGDADGEWIELYNTTNADIDINGFIIQDNNPTSHTIVSIGAVIVPANGYAVVGKNADSTANGGVTMVYGSSQMPGFNNSGDAVEILDPNMVQIDIVDYTQAGFPDPSGASIQLNPGVLDANLNATSNDTPGNWCESTTQWAGSANDLGTPGAANSCPVIP